MVGESVSLWHQLRKGGSDTDMSSSLLRGDRDSLQGPIGTLHFTTGRDLGVEPIPGVHSSTAQGSPASHHLATSPGLKLRSL